MEFLQLLLSCQFAGKPVMASRKVGCFLRLELLCQKIRRKNVMGHKVHILVICQHTIRGYVSHHYMSTYKSADNLTRIELLDLRFQLAKVPDQRTHALWQRMDSVDQVTEGNAP